MRKILKNYNKSKRLSGVSEGKIGTILGLKDKNNKYLVVGGDTIQYGIYHGILLYEPERKVYGIALTSSMYGDDKYDINSYGKFIDIPMDNGTKMEIKK